MRTILIWAVCLLIAGANSNSVYKVDLYQYAEIVSTVTKTNILIDNKVPAKEIYFFAPAKLEKNDYIQTFKDLLRDCNLQLLKRKNYYYVTLPKEIDIRLRKYTFHYLNVSEVKFIKNIFPGIRFQFFNSSNTLFYISDYNTHLRIKKICETLDIPYLSTDVRLTIFITDLQKLKNIGAKVESFGIDFSNLFKLENGQITRDSVNVFQFKAYLDFLEKNKVVEVLQRPTLHLTDEKTASFEIVKNIPVLVSQTSVEENKVTSQNQYQYRDIGLKIAIRPNIYDDHIYFDLNLTSETIDTLSETPTTNKLYYQNGFKMGMNESILLTGLKINETVHDNYKVPLLGDLPLIGPIFKGQITESKNQVLSVLIETVK